MTGQDVVIAFSRNGEADEINSLLRVVRQRGAKVVSILENAESTMASLSDLLLRVAVASENDPCGPIPLASALAHAALADVLCATVLTARGFDPGEFACVHPGGALGKRLRSSRD